ncbi:hypothetical protein SAMN04487970_1005164 [Paenibacillus tianmuensis]|uniref:Uncharacterized protein n=1 Tax=Paenibacillus tianmuensis TaxID=624147 RepID=A0A1G4Q674_9BACL|nr:hypothetical protein [Paenibacillus tianmuensis]SCW40002.1 hypothetical protein SAMN04487970_1005164 [Paenibacillus tianmuensis]
MEQQKSSRTRKLVALFVASTLVLGGTAGCSDSKCTDRNGDGYCDNGSGGSSGGHYYGGGGSGGSGSSSKASSDSSSGISKGGIGGSGSSSS